jgi:nitrite reductase/ring-hydroxylating ferredoxin subunit
MVSVIFLVSRKLPDPDPVQRDCDAGIERAISPAYLKDKAMAELFVSKIDDFAEGDRRIITHGELEIGVFHWQGSFYAYHNLCLHQGGPCCEGVIMHKVEDVLAADRTWLGQKFSADEAHFVCPWHGYEYDIKTGECAGNRKLKLRAFPVVQRGGELYVIAE